MGKRKNKAKKGIESMGRSLWKVAKLGATPLSFFEQLTSQDRKELGSSFSTMPMMQQAKTIFQIFTGRLTGINLIHDGKTPTYTQSLNFSDFNNKWTKAGGYGLVYWFAGTTINRWLGKSKVLPISSNVFPHTADIKKIAMGLLFGGGFGSVFQKPSGNQGSSQQQFRVQPQGTQLPAMSSGASGL